ncbi:MAG: CHAT domain-containing protein [Pseudomonadota bacterium]
MTSRKSLHQSEDDLDALIASQWDDPEVAVSELTTALDDLHAAPAVDAPDVRNHACGRLRLKLAAAYLDRRKGTKTRNAAEAHRAVCAAGEDLRGCDDPGVSADLHHGLGQALINTHDGNRADNLDRAIDHLTCALQLRTNHQAHSDKRAETCNALGFAYLDRVYGNRSDNVETAINHLRDAADHYNAQTHPADVARSLLKLGSAYRKRISGSRSENLETALEYTAQALDLLSADTHPWHWASAHHHMGATYYARLAGDFADNKELAISHYMAALTVRTPEEAPSDWVQSRIGLANAYLSRRRGDPSANLETAITLYSEAEAIATVENDPRSWAAIRNNLSAVYLDRIAGDPDDNLEKAIAYTQSLFQVYTRENDPDDWARTQNNLGFYYKCRSVGDRAANLEAAIAALEAATSIWTQQHDPFNWAMAQLNLGCIFAERISGDRADNLRRAISHHQSALDVRTLAEAPRCFLLNTRYIGHAHLELENFSDCRAAMAESRVAFLQLFTQAMDDGGAHEVIANAGTLFSDAAYAALALGDVDDGFELAMEGRAHQLAVSMSYTAADLDDQQRQNLAALREKIQAEAEAANAAHGADRLDAAQALAASRSELGRFVAPAVRTRYTGSGKLDQALDLVPSGGAIVVPVVTTIGTKLIVLVANGETRTTDVVHCAELTTTRLDTFIHGSAPGGTDGWLATMTGRDDRDATTRRRDMIAKADAVGDDLWTLIGARLTATLDGHGLAKGARLIVMPSGGLGILPIGLAQDPGTGVRLLDQYEVAYAPSLDVFARSTAASRETTAPSLSATINPTQDLAFAEAEHAMLATHFNPVASDYLDSQTATRGAVLKSLATKSYWHFCTHGEFAKDDARASALLLRQQERLSAGDVFAALQQASPRMVVLSACESGLHEAQHTPDEFIGMTGSFLAHGAACVLATLWPVDDRATALLIGRFYENHLGRNMRPAAALQSAQHWLRSATVYDLRAFLASVIGAAADAAAIRGLSQSLSLTDVAQTRFTAGMLETPDASIHAQHAGEPPPVSTDDDPQHRPFEHPYYWGGFILTGR